MKPATATSASDSHCKGNLCAWWAPSCAALVAGIVVTPFSHLLASSIGPSVPPPVEEDLTVSPVAQVRPGEPIEPIPAPQVASHEIVALGRTLFHDPLLSSDGTVSCASCHVIDDGGDDGRPVSRGVEGRSGDVNAPTVLNAALNFRQFWDGRAETLEEQIHGPIHHPNEMDSDWARAVAAVESQPHYREWFAGAYEDGVTGPNIADAVVTYEKTLLTPDSRFDRWLKGDDTALTQRERRGYQLFKERRCVGCHDGANLGGELFVRLGAVQRYYDEAGDASRSSLGRFNVTGNDRDRHVFRVPGLRNVERTAPYFHDGSVERLEQAVMLMFEHQLGMPVDAEEVSLICEFLRTLSADPWSARQ